MKNLIFVLMVMVLCGCEQTDYVQVEITETYDFCRPQYSYCPETIFNLGNRSEISRKVIQDFLNELEPETYEQQYLIAMIDDNGNEQLALISRKIYDSPYSNGYELLYIIPQLFDYTTLYGTIAIEDIE